MHNDSSWLLNYITQRLRYVTELSPSQRKYNEYILRVWSSFTVILACIGLHSWANLRLLFCAKLDAHSKCIKFDNTTERQHAA